MNKAKQPLSLRMHKKIFKKVKKDLKSGEDTITEPVKKEYPSEKEMLKKIPSKKAKIQRNHTLSMERSMNQKKAKLESKKSKRTATHQGVENSPPAHVHSEGKRWLTTLARQAKIKIKHFIKKTLKRN
ncbi:MAG: hypothetical protein FJZ57_02480 [Chlamydiae bacterium]|nr:hypothetical protein [Chlamydiota bacterium]